MAEDEFSSRGGVAHVGARMTARGRSFVIHKNATWPFARLRVGAERILITSLFGTFEVTRANLVAITRFRRMPVLADGVRFATSDHEDAVIFWALRAEKVCQELLRRGWKIR
ncbi:hypothetical protein ACFOOK_07845 [Micromonospora krabiensis]|uniref:hypothetical protein n=1 Tax=Micromonospora krabiensis TaxID=307121 RepID=UPI0012FD6716|nr:hypothetical protein [Micromonospora krabiensis]